MKVTEIDMGLNAIVRNVMSAVNSKLEVGILEGNPSYSHTTKKGETYTVNLASIGLFNEKGTKPKKYPKRAIPPRSFLRVSLEGRNLRELTTLLKELVEKVHSKPSLKFDKVLDGTGKFQKKTIKRIIKDKHSPKNADWTIKDKGFDDPLIGKTKDLYNGIDYKKV